MKNLFGILITLITTLLCLSFLDHGSFESNYSSSKYSNKIKGVCWVGSDSVVLRNFESLVETGANWISQTPFAWQHSYNKPDLTMETKRVLWGERDIGLNHTTQLAKKMDLKTILKPHIWLRRSNGKWRADIEMESAEDWNQWFNNYEEMILHYAVLAQQAEIEALCIGTELHIPSTSFPDRWRDMIKKIRCVYDGQLTYAANFYKEYEQVEFWDDLDFIGIQAYFPLSGKSNPTKEELKNGWKKPMRKMQTLAKKYNKQVVFTEIGYTNITYAAKEPWTWPQQMQVDNVNFSDQTQAICYEAMYESFWDEPWFRGVFIWKWFHGGYKYSLEERNAIRHAKRDSLQKIGKFRNWPRATFSPQGKPAQIVMKRWFLQ